MPRSARRFATAPKRWLAGIVAASMLAACGGISFENENRLDGTYTLRSIDLRPLPYAPGDRSVAITVSGGVLTIAQSGEWTESLTGTVVQDGQSVERSVAESGRWSLRYPYVDLVRADGALAYSGVFSVVSGPQLELIRAPSGRPVRYLYAR